MLKVSRCTVQEVIKKKIEAGDIKDGKKSGRPTKLTKSNLNITSIRNRTKSSQELSSDLAQTSSIRVLSSTIRRALVKECLYGQMARKKPYLRQENRKRRLEFAKDQKKQTIE